MVPPRIEGSNTAREIGAAAVLGLQVAWVLGNAVVNAIDGFNELLQESLGMKI